MTLRWECSWNTPGTARPEGLDVRGWVGACGWLSLKERGATESLGLGADGTGTRVSKGSPGEQSDLLSGVEAGRPVKRLMP